MSGIRLIKPHISFEDVEADFRKVFESGLFTRGANSETFRNNLSAYTGAAFIHLATSATTALWACLKAVGIQPGDDVVVSDFSFPATANVVEDLGARPVFADVSRDTYNMTVETLEAAITSATKAVIFVDALGNPTGLTDVAKLCRTRGLPLIEDAACAIGSSEYGRKCGVIADLTCFSFHPRKLLCTGEGGAITTNNPKFSEWFDVKLAHGAKGLKGAGLDFVDYGYNFRLPELQSIMGIRQLESLDAIITERNAQRDTYIQGLAPLGFVAQATGPGVRYNVQSMVFIVPDGYNRDELIGKLRAINIEATIGTYAMSHGTYYLGKYNTPQPGAGYLQHSTLTLPCYIGLDVNVVIEEIKKLM